MQSQNEAGCMIDLNEVINMIWNKAASDQNDPYFDFVKVHDQILMSGIKRYTMNIRKMDFSGFDAQRMEDMIESASTELYDNIAKANLDYMRHGMKMGAKLLAELIV